MASSAVEQCKKRVLVADTPSAKEVIFHALKDQFDLVFSYSLREARWQLQNGCDVVLCGLQFDESRICELLLNVKENQATYHIPFICLNTKEDDVLHSVTRLAAQAMVSMGADMFIDLSRWRSVLGDDRAFARFRAHLHLLQ
jgi:hypothetical protein